MWILAAVILLSQDDQIPALIEKLRSDKAAEREQAVRRLRDLGDKASPELEKVARDTDAEVAARARQLLRFFAVRGRITPALRKFAPDIEEVLFSGNDARCTAILLANTPLMRERGALGPADLDVVAAGAVRGAVTVENQRLVCWALQRHHLKSAAGELVAYLRQPLEKVLTIETLGIIGNKDTTRHLTPFLADPEFGRAAAAAMERLGSRDLLVTLSLELLMHDDAKVRKHTVEWLGTLGEKTAIAALADRLEDKNEEVRQTAIESLVRLEARDRVPALLRVIRKDPEESCKRAAGGGIAWLDAREVIPELLAMLQDPDVLVVIEATRALGLLQAKEALEPLSRRLGPAAIEALGHIGDPAAIPVLLQDLEKQDVVEYLCILDALGNLHAKETAPKIISLLDRKVGRERVIRLLAQLQAVEAAPRIVPFLKDPDGDVRRAAIQALGVLGASEAAPELEKLVVGATSNVDAILALARMGGRAAVGPLLEVRAPVEKGPVFRFDAPPERDLLTAMNRFGNPDAFKKLSGLVVRRMVNRTNLKSRREAIREVEKLHGLRIDIDKALDKDRLDKPADWPTCEFQILPVAEFLKGLSGGELLLTGDRILLLPEKQAYAHWKSWWAAQQKK